MKNKKIHNVNDPGFKTPKHYFESVEDRVLDKLKEEDPSINIETPGYVVPDSYFDSLEEKVLDKLDRTIDLKDIQQTGFKAPQGYIDSIEEKILSQLKEDDIVKVIPLFSRRNIIYATGIAAMVVIMLGIFLKNSDDLSIDNLDIELVESYLEQQDIDTYDLASLLSEEDLTDESLGIINDDFSEESLEDYLIDNANIEDIIEQ
ncbi:MAG: hypothetical protein KJP09_08210 [Bacteroidia bacterium]|nr:hypothetical protein [Bacteroidia bacterium]NND11617.1 hypothetical protein [Flavobacteriaceae bacterium]NNK27190.1 hypothetical protein [Flavobacteriaceae bacterium]